MRPLLAVLILVALIPATAWADGDSDRPPPSGGICIQSITGETKCL